MRVEETLTFAEFWSDERFLGKRPNLAGSNKVAFGDNIYRPDGNGGWLQLDSHHSLHDGATNPVNLKTDTGTDRVLVSQDFVYWGGEGPLIPQELRSFGDGGEDICAGRGHKCIFSPELVVAADAWIKGISVTGPQGRPGQWPQ